MAMRGALPHDIRALHESYYLATSTAMAVALYEGVDAAARRAAA
jgi:protocatechuate 4,5-dioxygenase beta chain